MRSECVSGVLNTNIKEVLKWNAMII
jgi:hypothetical protein